MLRTRRLLSSAALAALLVTGVYSQCLQPEPAAADSTDATLTVIVDLDANGNGVYDSETDQPQPGIDIVVSDAVGEKETGTTGDDGTYTLKHSEKLTGGRYFVVAEIPAGLGDLSPVPESESFAALSTTADVTSEDQTVRMGVVRAPEATIETSQPTPEPIRAQPTAPRPPAPRFALGDYAWHDDNRNGVQDDGEPPASRISVQLLDDDGSVLKSMVTSPAGRYGFDDLAAGTYSVRFAGLPSNSRLTVAGIGGRDQDSDADVTGTTAPITLGVGEPGTRLATDDDQVRAGYVNRTVDAGIAPLRFGITDQVWSDLNADGVRQDSEPAATATVNLLDDHGNTVTSTITDAQGRYAFTGVTHGRYQLRFAGLPAHRSLTLRGTGGDRARDSDPDPVTGVTAFFPLDQHSANLQSATDAERGAADFLATGLSAGLVGSYSIGDTVWRDYNGDGVLSPGDGDRGIKGVTVQLLGPDAGSNVISTRTTSSTGRYTFSQLPAGSYHLKFSHLEPGLVFTSERQGGNSAVDSDVDTMGVSATITLGDDNPADTTIDAGVTTPGDFSGALAGGAGVVPAADSTLSSTGGVDPAVPLTGLALVGAGGACLVAGRRRGRSATLDGSRVEDRPADPA